LFYIAFFRTFEFKNNSIKNTVKLNSDSNMGEVLSFAPYDSSSSVVLDNNTIELSYDTRLYNIYPSAPAFSISSFNVSNNYISHNSNSVAEYVIAHDFNSWKVLDFILDDNTIIGNESETTTASQALNINLSTLNNSVLISNNRISNFGSSGIFVYANSSNDVCTFKNNSFYNNGNDTALGNTQRAGIEMSGSDSAGVIIDSNIFYDNRSTPTQYYGISIANTHTVFVDNNSALDAYHVGSGLNIGTSSNANNRTS